MISWSLHSLYVTFTDYIVLYFTRHIKFMPITSLTQSSYIKEFVHGDFGRTRPNMSTILGVDTDILELDVTVCITFYFNRPIEMCYNLSELNELKSLYRLIYVYESQSQLIVISSNLFIS